MPFSFINGALMWGSGLISIPIIIHLLNRRRFRIVEWAAMEWLLQAIKENKRRVTLEQLILLALRCLIILLIVLAVSKIFLTGGVAAVSRLMDTKTDWVIVLDDSFTMGQGTSTGTCFDRGKKAVQELLKKIHTVGARDSFTVMTSEKEGRKLPAAAQVDADFVNRLNHKLEHTNPVDLKLFPTGLLASGVEALRNSQNANKALVVVSDCRLQDWRFGDAQKASLAKALEDAKQLGIKTYLVDVGPEDPKDYANLAVVSVEPTEKTVQARAITDLVATVANFGPNDVTNVSVQFTITSPEHGRTPLDTEIIGKITAGGKATVTQSYKFKTPGSYAVTAEIGTDSLPADNAYHRALRVGRGVDVLLVDGDPGLERSEAETFALQKALRPFSAYVSGVNPRVVDAAVLMPSDIESSSVIFLANVGRLSTPNRDALTKFVERGGGLVILPGGKVEPKVFNREMYDGGKRVAPCELVAAVGEVSTGDPDKDRFVRFSSDKLDHPLLAGFSGVVAPLFRVARFYRRFVVQLPKDPEKRKEVTVVARYADEDRSPAIIERRIGKGAVILLTSTADDAWNNWQKIETYPIFMQELVAYLYQPAGAVQNLAVGAKYVKAVDLARYAPVVSVERPRTSGALKRAAEEGPTRTAVVAVKKAETMAAGIYTIKLSARAGGEPLSKTESTEYFAANLDVSRSKLRRPELSSFRSRVEEMGITYATGADDIWKQAPEERINLWHAVLIVLGCCMALESFLGWKFGHHAK